MEISAGSRVRASPQGDARELCEQLSAPSFAEYVRKSTTGTVHCQHLCSSATHRTGLAWLFTRRLLYLSADECESHFSTPIAAQGDGVQLAAVSNLSSASGRGSVRLAHNPTTTAFVALRS